MCFSATASFVASGSIGGIGVLSVKSARSKRERAFAFVPLFFAGQQALEGVVWLSLDHPLVKFLAAQAFLFFAYVFWPVFLPWAIARREPLPERRAALRLFIVAGLGIALYGAMVIVSALPSPVVFHQSLRYGVPVFFPIYAPLYAFIVCTSCLLSSARWIVVFGVALAVSLVAAVMISSATGDSVWCFFAAWLSVLVVVHLRLRTRV